MQYLTDCLGCKPTQSIFPTNNISFERYYNYVRYRFLDYLTPLRLHDLCRVDEEGNWYHKYTQNTNNDSFTKR